MPAFGASSTASSHSVFAQFKRHPTEGLGSGNASTTDLALDVGAANGGNNNIHIDNRGAVTGGKPSIAHRRDSSILSLTGSARDLGSNVKRSISLRSHRTNPSSSTASSSANKTTRSPSSAYEYTPLSSASLVWTPDEVAQPPLPSASPPSQPPLPKGKLSLSAKVLTHKFKSTDALPLLSSQRPYLDGVRLPQTNRQESFGSMLAAQPTASAPMSKKPSAESRPSLHPQGSYSRDLSSSHSNGSPLAPTPPAQPASHGGPLNANTIYTQIQETSAKRMATIDYLRKLHEGDIFYFGSFHYSPGALQAMPSMQTHKLARRATNYFILGYSLPALLDMNSGNPLEYLKALSSLLTEFEEYQTLSGFDSSGNAVRQNRMGQMFKGGNVFNRNTKARRSSVASDNLHIDSKHAELLGVPGSGIGSPHELPSPINPTGHEFSFLLTPHIPFDPEFATTLGTLCDTLIDAYAKLMELVAGPETCNPAVGEAFGKADKAIRKVLVANVVREFEDTTRAGVKGEIAGLGKLTLGGLM